MNSSILRIFVFIRQYAFTREELTKRLKELERKFSKHFKDVYEAIN